MSINTVGPILLPLVTAVGCVLSFIVIALIWCGKKLPAQGKTPEKLRFKDLEIQTSLIPFLLVLSLFTTVFPLAGYYWLTYKIFQDVEVDLNATVEERPGIPARDIQVALVMIRPKTETPICDYKKVRNGEFRCIFTLENLRDKFEVRVRKNSEEEIARSVVATQPTVLVTLAPEVCP